jgi:PPE-repeat protein
LLTAVLIIAPGIAVSDDLAVPKVISAGVDAYKKEGPSSALTIWLTDSPLAGDKAAQSQAAQLSAIETYYGKLLSAELIKLYRISPSSKLTFMEAQFEKGALFMKFLTFNTGKNEVVTTFLFHTDPAQILPSDLLYPDD